MTDPPPASPTLSRSAWEAIKTFSPVTIAGLALILLFLYCLSVDTYVVRWWLMMPIASAGCGLFLIQRRRTTGAESRICLVGFWLMLILFLVRDAALSKELADLFDTVNYYKGSADVFNNAMEDIFMGTGN
jgi:hypothetical protein